jgi:Family of unknown function (DUF6088)
MDAMGTSKLYRKESAASLVLKHASQHPGAVFAASDVFGATPSAASRALSRLVKSGTLMRVSKGLYYLPKHTLMGPVQPSAVGVLKKRTARGTRPTGTTAANMLGLSTQVPATPEYVLYASTRPAGTHALNLVVREVRSTYQAALPELAECDAALLEVLRQRGVNSELPPRATVNRIGEYLTALNPDVDRAASSRFSALLSAAMAEPPRVRAMLGALLQHFQFPEAAYAALRGSLNPLSRFEFGLFRTLPNAKEWQSK